jgi:hypothetical protein
MVKPPTQALGCGATPMQLALARGHRWLAMLESGEAKSITELAAREKIDNSYMCRMLNLTTLAPDIVAAILDETLPPHVTVHELAISPPVLWEEQRTMASKAGGSPMNMPAPIMRWKSSRNAASAASSGMSLSCPARHAS